ncbi:GNAT family N-acetyltransferase [Caulobacter endophyticus]|uniref:GNAT family N-acetyltransferase n=1 Tax=Caulobacter endophyticus TaxID=2172652 RepID=UPI00240FEB26|nr:GNAT family N-acetyltransferase [Caulobacter endophyticus]MDG2527567.1 GNAT family N-acetyltransferase [Caulobacter endophyticus]
MSAIAIRPAVDTDISALVALNASVQALHAALSPKIFKPAVDPVALAAFLRGMLDQHAHRLLLAQVDGAAAGYGWAEVQNRPETPFALARRRLYLHHLAVDPAFRRRGIAAALLAALESEARALGLETVVLDAWADNAGAQAFFAAAGYAPLNLTRAKRLG